MNGENFRPYLRALHRVGYNDRLALEPIWTDLPNQVGPARIEVSAMDIATAVLQIAGGDRQVRLQLGAGVPGLADFNGMNEVWDDWVPPGDAPPRATVQANLARPAWLIEIVVTAAV